jgi:hypothetical protein
MTLTCGCGERARYIVGTDQNGEPIEACNKYSRCLTRDELLVVLKLVNITIGRYRTALEKISKDKIFTCVETSLPTMSAQIAIEALEEK